MAALGQAVDPVFQAKMLDMLKQTGRPAGWGHGACHGMPLVLGLHQGMNGLSRSQIAHLSVWKGMFLRFDGYRRYPRILKDGQG